MRQPWPRRLKIGFATSVWEGYPKVNLFLKPNRLVERKISHRAGKNCGNGVHILPGPWWGDGFQFRRKKEAGGTF